MSTVANPTNSVLALITYPDTIPGLIAEEIALCIERYTVLYETLKSSPVRYIASLRAAIANLVAESGEFAPYVQIAGAQRCALELAYLFAIDENNRDVLRRMEKNKSFDALGNYTPRDQSDPVMTVDEIESVLADVRRDIQTIIEDRRELQSLKNMALVLLNHVNKIKLEREKIITATIDNSLPIHLVCLKYGLPYNYAERILSINKIANPNFIHGEVKIYAR